jgi:hypothetical protein
LTAYQFLKYKNKYELLKNNTSKESIESKESKESNTTKESNTEIEKIKESSPKTPLKKIKSLNNSLNIALLSENKNIDEYENLATNLELLEKTESLNLKKNNLIIDDNLFLNKKDNLKKNILMDLNTSGISSKGKKNNNLNISKNVSFLNNSKKKQNTKMIMLENINTEDFGSKKSYIVKIRQFTKCFKNELTDFIGSDEKKFNNSLSNMSIDTLKNLYDLILLEVCVLNSNEIDNSKLNLLFFNVLEVYLSKKFNKDFNGVYEKLQDNPDFSRNLKIIFCKINLSEIITPEIKLAFSVILS